ncbi:MAG: aspartate kinase [Eubacteriales bacterium]
MPIKVVKFGGSSLADAVHFQRVAEIIKADPARRYVVPSAPGKRFLGDDKITDLLYQCYQAASNDQPIHEIFERITARYTDIVRDLGLDVDLKGEFERIRLAIQHHAGRDYVASRGEYLNGLILSAYLGFTFLDPEKYILFNDNGTLDDETTNALLAKALMQYTHAVIPGFYGSMPNGTIKTFARGGSDITGSIVARAAEADLYENWTDVSGFMMADPRIVDNPQPIDTITYRELRELSYMGAAVLHEDSIFPVRFSGIPINIKNTNAPEDPGSMIVAQADIDNTRVVTGIAGKKGFSIFAIEKDLMNAEIGFGRRVLEVFEKVGIGFEHLPSGIDTMSVVVHTKDVAENREFILNELCRTVNPDTIIVEDGLALIAVVGRGMIRTKGTAAKVFTALAEADINIRMIDQGSSELNIVIGVEEKDFEQAIRAIYHAFHS